MDEIKLKDAIYATVAKEIFLNLTEEQRSAVLTDAIAKALKAWDFEHMVKKAIMEEGDRQLKELMQEPKWKQAIHDQIMVGLSKYLQQLPRAVHSSMVQMMHGDLDAHYSKAAILNHWPKG
jgi:hypothetical protein